MMGKGVLNERQGVKMDRKAIKGNHAIHENCETSECDSVSIVGQPTEESRKRVSMLWMYLLPLPGLRRS